MMRSFILFLLLVLGFKNSFAATGKELSQNCIACHGQEGISNNNLWPNLAGQKKDYIIKQLKAFRSGERKDPIMNPMAATLSDEDMQNLATYFSSLK